MKVAIIFMVLFLSSGTLSMAFPRSSAIIDGVEVNRGEFPYQLRLEFKCTDEIDAELCGAVLIAPDIALTAGHCCNCETDYMYVTAGEHDVDKTDGTEQVREVTQTIIHSGYKFPSKDNDICGLILDIGFKLNENVNVVDIGDTTPEPKKQPCTVSGFGATKDKPSSTMLLKAYVDILPDDDCSNYASLFKPKMMICAGHNEGGQDACQGDSGGPLICDGKLNGLVSYGWKCGLASFPGVYTKVEYHSDFIKNLLRMGSGISKAPHIHPLYAPILLSLAYVISVSIA